MPLVTATLLWTRLDKTINDRKCRGGFKTRPYTHHHAAPDS
jgi:hypothetical protein